MSLTEPFGGRLYRRYLRYFATLISAVLIAGGASNLYFSYYEIRDATVALHREKAAAAAFRIEQFVREIEQHVGWTNLLLRGTDPLMQRHMEFMKLLKQAPAITDITWLDARGHEQIRVSRVGVDQLRSDKDLSSTPAFIEARRHTTYRSAVFFREETEPYIILASVAGSGVTLVEVNLKFVWDVITRIRIDRTGHAYVVDANGHLLSHPDISLVLNKTDLSSLPQVLAARAIVEKRPSTEDNNSGEAFDIAGQAVLSAHAAIEPLGWTVFVEQSRQEALAPLYASMWRTGWLVLLGLILALGAGALLARRMVRPIRALQEGAARLGAGELNHNIRLSTNDELETLANEFNRMAAHVRESHVGLEQKVADRTQQLVAANRAKSHFLAAASHDLRQPMHALGLFVAQLKDCVRDPEALPLIVRVESAVMALEGLLDALLDISRLDAGVVVPNVRDFYLNTLLERIENIFAADAEAKGILFRIAHNNLVVKTDPVLLERILINLVSNAVRYTQAGGILVGCRRCDKCVRLEVWDSGIGIAPELQKEIFQEFYQVDNSERSRQKGLGLGLAIGARLAALLHTKIDIRSQPDHGSVFSIELPRGDASLVRLFVDPPLNLDDGVRDSHILIVDDDTLVRESITGLLTQWGCQVIAAANGSAAIAAIATLGHVPDVILCDCRLPDGEKGRDTILRLREHTGVCIPAALITGDTAPKRIREAKESGIPLLHKPVRPARLRALLVHLVGAYSANWAENSMKGNRPPIPSGLRQQWPGPDSSP